MDKKVKWIREETGESICYVLEDNGTPLGKWTRWNKSKLWQAFVAEKRAKCAPGESPFLGLDKKNGFPCFQAALKAGYTNVQ